MKVHDLDFKKFRWFFTSSGRLVIGGKSAESNESIIRVAPRDSIIMHTEQPGSPFCVIMMRNPKGFCHAGKPCFPSMDENPTDKDMKEAAIFCGCLSKAWKAKKKEAEVHVFTKEAVFKEKFMKTGTFGVRGSLKRMNVKLKLYLTFQEEKLRAVPFETNIASIIPGSMKKEQAAEEISKKLKIKKEEALSALPSDNIDITWF